MEARSLELAGQLLHNPGLVRGAAEAVARRDREARALLQHRRLPDDGWDDATLTRFVSECALLDANNFAGNAGAGEREGRVVCGMVRRRHLGLAHGVGRSGEIGAVQPKAAGSSVIAKLTSALLKDLVRRVLGMRRLQGLLVLPMATGMSLSLVLQCLRHSEKKRRREQAAADQALDKAPDKAVEAAVAAEVPPMRYVLWPRIDQKTCLKAIIAAGFEPIVVENLLDGDMVRTDLGAVRSTLQELGPASVLCVLSTTSCFAPRVPDDVEGIAALCAEFGVAHVINNAYGLQCTKICHSIEQACRLGRVDAVVQSTDKNLMVPVGGAVVTGPDKDFIEVTLSKSYPGRASMAPVLDVFLTLVSLGKNGFEELRKGRLALVPQFQTQLELVAAKHGERVLATTKRNSISFAVSLQCAGADKAAATRFGSMLFTRGVSGARVVAPGAAVTVGSVPFASYGASIDSYPTAYVTVACAIGIVADEVDLLMKRFDKTFVDFKAGKKA